MTSAVAPARDLLSQVIDRLRPMLARNIPVRERIVTFWLVLVESRELGSSDVVADDFRQLAQEIGLTTDLGRHGAEHIKHVLQWGLRGCNPFEKGRLQ